MLPIVLPPLVLIEVWAYLLQPGSGLIDRILGAVGLPQPSWLSDPHLALVGILLIGFPWISNLGFLIFLGGLQNLPKDVLDASRMDGVGALRRVFAIDIPLLLPQFRIVVILSGIYAVQNFVPILLLTNGGPGTATLVPGLDMYQSAFQSDQYGYGMAIGTLLFVVMLAFTLIAMRALRLKDRLTDRPAVPRPINTTRRWGTVRRIPLRTPMSAAAVLLLAGGLAAGCSSRSAPPAARAAPSSSRRCCRPTPARSPRPTTPA